MYDVNLKNVKKGRRFYYIFLVMGILFFVVIGGLFVFSSKRINDFDSETISTRVEVKSHISDEGTNMYSPIYYYSVNGNDYICGTNSSSSFYPKTDNVKIFYNSNDPSNCMTESSKKGNYIMLVALLIPIIFILVGIINIRKVNKRIKDIKELIQKGKLVKNLPYRLENTGMTVNNVPVQRPVVEYTLASGSTITLYGDPRHDRKYVDADGMVDLLIDESNPNNYYIDFEINRLSGNFPQDYSNQNQPNNLNSQYYENQPNNYVNQSQQDDQNINNY